MTHCENLNISTVAPTLPSDDTLLGKRHHQEPTPDEIDNHEDENPVASVDFISAEAYKVPKKTDDVMPKSIKERFGG